MNFVITELAGDGIGPEVTAEAIRVLHAVGRRFGHTIEVRPALFGGCAIDACGEPFPPETREACRASDAVLLGAVGGPQWDALPRGGRPEDGLLALRRDLGLFANLRPVKASPLATRASPLKPELVAGVDMVVVRELTGGIYFGEKGRDGAGRSQRAVDTCTYTVPEIERLVRVGATLSRSRRRKLTSVDKANVLETSRLWREVCTRIIRDEFPDVSVEHLLVDAASMHLITRAASFDVIVTENMFGDILSDEASVLAGSLGMLPSASLGEGKFGLYEPIHGSAPTIAGRGIANPIGAILSVAMLLRLSLGLEEEAARVESAVAATLERGLVTADLARDGQRTATTAQVGDAVVAALGS